MNKSSFRYLKIARLRSKLPAFEKVTVRESERTSHRARSAVVQAKTRKPIDERHKGGIYLDDDT
jgi:hypothetical protein